MVNEELWREIVEGREVAASLEQRAELYRAAVLWKSYASPGRACQFEVWGTREWVDELLKGCGV